MTKGSRVCTSGSCQEFMSCFHFPVKVFFGGIMYLLLSDKVRDEWWRFAKAMHDEGEGNTLSFMGLSLWC